MKVYFVLLMVRPLTARSTRLYIVTSTDPSIYCALSKIAISLCRLSRKEAAAWLLTNGHSVPRELASNAK
jgi:hypothetical protein